MGSAESPAGSNDLGEGLSILTRLLRANNKPPRRHRGIRPQQTDHPSCLLLMFRLTILPNGRFFSILRAITGKHILREVTILGSGQQGFPNRKSLPNRTSPQASVSFSNQVPEWELRPRRRWPPGATSKRENPKNTALRLLVYLS